MYCRLPGQAASEIAKLYFSHISEVARNLSMAQGNQNKRWREKKPPTALQEEIYAHCTVFLIFKIFSLKGVPEKLPFVAFKQYLGPVRSNFVYCSLLKTLFQLPPHWNLKISMCLSLRILGLNCIGSRLYYSGLTGPLNFQVCSDLGNNTKKIWTNLSWSRRCLIKKYSGRIHWKGRWHQVLLN